MEHPRDRDLGDGGAVAIGDRPQAVRDGEAMGRVAPPVMAGSGATLLDTRNSPSTPSSAAPIRDSFAVAM
ncbi:MAG TPA: hypothetical protein VM785_06005 [Gaiellales bacterium]|nr:hypothetical protein [Gaiellales bacterium]